MIDVEIDPSRKYAAAATEAELDFRLRIEPAGSSAVTGIEAFSKAQSDQVKLVA